MFIFNFIFGVFEWVFRFIGDVFNFLFGWIF